MNKGIILAFLLVSFSCSVKYLEPNEFVKYANNRNGGYCLTKEIDRYSMDLFYRPIDYFKAQAIITGDKKDIASIHNTYGNAYYFVLRIQSKDSINIVQKILGEKAQENSGNSMGMPNFKGYAIFMQNEEEWNCLEAISENNWGVYNDLATLFVFSTKSSSKERLNLKNSKIVIKEFGLNIGNVQFDLSKFTKDKVKLWGKMT